MAKINLLPWRAERRERRKREFFTRLVIAAVAAVVVVVVWAFWMSLRIDTQNSRNAYLTGQIQQLDAKIVEIKNYEKEKDRLLARKRIVEQLQSNRSQMVHLFDQLVQTIPDGARLTALKQQADKLTLDGVAQSNATVANYMQNIEASPWMGPARLIKTENVHASPNMPYEFELVVTLGTPASGSTAATPAAGSSVAMPAAGASVADAAPVAASAAPSASPLAALPAGSAAPAGAPPASALPAAASHPAAGVARASAPPPSGASRAAPVSSARGAGRP